MSFHRPSPPVPIDESNSRGGRLDSVLRGSCAAERVELECRCWTYVQLPFHHMFDPGKNILQGYIVVGSLLMPRSSKSALDV